MLPSSKWTFFSLLMLTVWTERSVARSCYQCGQAEGINCPTKPCPVGSELCATIRKNGTLEEKRCEDGRFSNAITLSIGNCKNDTHGNMMKQYGEYLRNPPMDRALEDDDVVEFCVCDSDNCNGNSGTASSVSGLMFGTSIAAAFLARLVSLF